MSYDEKRVMSQADKLLFVVAGSIVSMHSVMKHKPRPLVPRTKLNPKAYNAAMQQIPEMDLQFVSAASHGYARRESLRRRSSGEVSDQSVKIADGKSANLIKVAIDGHTNNAGQRGQSRNK